MTVFLVEVYVPRKRVAEYRAAVARVRSAAEALARNGSPVGHLHSVFVPDDETAFHLFTGPSLDAVKAVGRRAALDFDRIVEAVQ